MAEVPGIVFADGPAGRRARIAGTGLDVFEVVKAYHELGDDRDTLVEEFTWITPTQVDAALMYYAAYTDEIDALVSVDVALIPESLRST